MHPRVSLGVEINPGEQELGPLATVFLLTEQAWRPSLSLGTSSDRIGSPKGMQSVYLTATKLLPGTPVAPYASLNWSGWDQQFNLPFGASVALGENFHLRPMYDGERSHFMVGASAGPWSITGLYIWLEHLGVAISRGWGGGGHH